MDDDWITHSITSEAPALPPVAAPAPASDDGWDTYKTFGQGAPAPSISGYEAAGGKATWEDVAHGLAMGTRGAGATLAGAAASLPGMSRDAQQYWRDVAAQQLQAQQESEEAMTPAAQGAGISHPLVWAAEQAPAMGALVGAGALGTVAAGPVGGAVAGAAAMGGMSRGDLENRLVAQGIEPTQARLAAATLLGAATGVVPEIGLPAKIATGALVKRALGATEGAITFGGLGAGEEALGQQAEKEAGKREGYDPSAIVGAGMGQAEFGGAMGALHGRGTGGEAHPPGAKAIEQHQDQEGGAFTATRSGKGDARKETVQGTAGGKPPPDVTPGVTPEEKVTGPAPPPSPIVDPAVAMAAKGEGARPTGAPPAAEEAAPLVPPTPTPERAPGAVPGAPRTPPGDDLQAQHAEVLDRTHPREAMQYPPGVEPLPLTKAQKASYGSTPLPDGSTLVYDRNGPSGINARKIKLADETGKLDEYVQGALDTNKEIKPTKAEQLKAKAAEKAAAKEPVQAAAEAPAAAPEVAAPIPAREEAARVAEAPAAAPAPEVTPGVTPEPTVASVPFMMTNAMRGELSARGLSDEHIANMTPAQAHEILATPPEAKALTVPAGAAETALAERPRVLEAAQTEAEKLRMGQAKRQEVARRKAEKKALAAQEKATGKHYSKKELADLEGNNKAAADVIARHPRPAGETLEAMHERVAAMLQDAHKSGVRFKDEFGEGTPHGDGVLLLSEARDLARKAKPSLEEMGRFMHREDLVRKGEGEEAVRVRRAEGAEKGALGSPEGAVEAERGEGAREAEHELTPEEQLMRKQEEEKEPEDRWAVAADAPRGDILKKIEAARAIARDPNIGAEERDAAQRGVERLEASMRGERPEEDRMARRRQESEELRKAEPVEAPKVAAFKTAATGRRGGAFAGFRPEAPAKVSLKREGVLKQEIDRGPGAVEVQLRRDQPKVEVQTTESMTAREMMDRYFKLSDYPAFIRPMVKVLADHLVRLAGDVPVHMVDHYVMRQTLGHNRGVYDPTDHQIFLSNQMRRGDTPLHELFHAVTHMGLKEDPHLRGLMKDLHSEMMQSFTVKALLKRIPALADPEEFLTNLMTKPEVQEALKKLPITNELAERIGMPKWRKGTIWNGVLDVIRQAIGWEPRATSAIEAAMAISELASHERFPGEMGTFMGRYTKANIEERLGARRRGEEDEEDKELYALFDPVDRHQNEEQAGGRYKEMGEKAGVAAHDAMLGVKAAFQRNTPKFMNGVQLSRWFGKHFTDEKGNIIDHILTIGRRKGVELNEWRTKDLPVISRAVINSIKYKGNMKDYSDLLHMSTKFDIDASKPPRDLKGRTFEVSKDDWQKNKNWAKAHEKYNALPPELREQYNSERDFYRDKQKRMAEQHLNSILDNYPLPAGVTRDEMWKRIRENTLTDDDLEHYTNLKALSEIHADQKLLKGDRVYFPAYRDGNFVVTGRYAMPVGGHDTDVSGKDLPDNIREFDDREEAHKYVTGTHMHANVEIVRYAKDTGEKLVGAQAREEAADTARGGPSNVVERFEVTLQREHTEMHRSYADAQRAYDDMREHGVQELSGVLDKRKEGDWGKINSEFGAAMERRIKDRDDLSDDQKKALIEEARNYALVRRSALQSHLVHRRYVAGADYGNVDALRSYSEAANRHAINAKYAPELDAAMKRMEDQDNANRRNPDISYQSSTVANELRERAYRSPDALSYKNAPWVNRLMQLAYMHYMVGPRHLMMMQSHPYVYSAPEMAGRHGVAAYKALHDAARDLGGDFAGVREGVGGFGKLVRAAFKQDPEAAAQLAKMKDMTEGMLSRLKGDEREDMESMRKTGELHSGFDDEFYGASGMQKVDAMVRQLTSAQDAQNRAVVALSAYRLERAKGSSREEALAYSRRVVQDTIGINSPMDMGSALKNPMARMFMQFKHFPMRQLELMGRNLYNAFAHESKEVKAEAWKAFAHQFTSSFAMAGVHGLPIGTLKVLGVVAYGLGIGPSPAQWDDRTRRWLAGILGSTGANVLMDGVLAAVPHAPNLNNMFSRDLDLAFGEPRMVGGQPDLWGYAVNTFLGAPASTVKDSLTGVQKIIQGDWLGPNGALSYLPAPRILNDIAKAQGLFTTGLTTSTGKQLRPASAADAAWRAMGFGTQEAQRSQSGRAAAQADIQEQQAEQKLTKGAQLKAQAQAKRQQTIMGLPVTPKTRQMLQQREEIYQ